MAHEQHREPWEEVEAIMRMADPDRLHKYLGTLPPGETARVISRLNREDQESVFALLPPRQAADLVMELPKAHATELLGGVPPALAAAVLAVCRAMSVRTFWANSTCIKRGRSSQILPPTWLKARGD